MDVSSSSEHEPTRTGSDEGHTIIIMGQGNLV